MSEKRFSKLESIAADTRGWVRKFGDPKAAKGIIAWGSSFGMLSEWIETHPEYRVFMPEILHPFPLEAFTEWRKGLDETTTVELSYQGQFHRYLSSLTDMNGVRRFARSAGLPMSMRALHELLGLSAAPKEL